MPSSPSPAPTRILLWDLPVRLFHWTLVLCVTGAYLTLRADNLVWHARFGQAVLVLVLFRILWGLVGSDTARFRQFLRGPGAALRHLGALAAGRHDAAGDSRPGHNPAGAWMVVLMLALLLFQTVTGLLGDDGESFVGPLAGWFPGWLDYDRRRLLTRLHGWNFAVIKIVIFAHVLAIAIYWLRLRDNLIGPMITGRKRMAPALAARVGRIAPTGRAALILVLVASVVVLAVWLAPPAD